VKVSADRILYLSRVITRKLKDNMNLVQKADDETVRRAIVRVLTDAYKELEQIEDKAQAASFESTALSHQQSTVVF
jgi:hypothetical protein